MAARVLFSAPSLWWPLYERNLRDALDGAGVEAELTTDAGDAGSIDYIIYRPGGPVADFTSFTGVKAVLSLWAGVENIASDATLNIPLCRMVDQGLTRGMVEWVAGHVLRCHLGLDAHVLGQDGLWRDGIIPPLAGQRGVGMLGLGELGTAAAITLAGLGFDVHGWSRRPKTIEGIETYSGDAGLDAVLGRSDILVTLLPATPQTENILNARTLGLLPPGACLINPGRGSLIDDDALLAALDAGQIGHATLDVFRIEPLPPEHRYWSHPRVTVTPHIASETRPETAARAIAENIRRGEAGMDFLNLVDRKQGY
jgi:glyoxylate/hydroxypyruvate reductase A